MFRPGPLLGIVLLVFPLSQGLGMVVSLDLLQWLVARFIILTKILLHLDLTARRAKSSVLNPSSQISQQIIYSPEDGGEGWSRAPGGCWRDGRIPGPWLV
jgi:hypothetical protein